MRKRAAALRWCVLGLLIGAATGTVARAETLRWKFKSGETLHYLLDQKTVTAGKVNGRDIKTTQTQTIDMEWAIKSVGADGKAEMTQTITRMRTKIDSPFGLFEYDSSDSKEPVGPAATTLVPLLKALVGAPFVFKMSALGELSDVKVPAKLTEALAKAGPAGGSGMFSEDGLKNMITESSLVLPKDEVAKGKTWTQQVKIPTPLATMVLDKTYAFQGPDAKAGSGVDRIDLESKVALQPAPGGNIEITVKSQEGKGGFLFDSSAGRIVSSDIAQSLKMTIKFMNMEMPQETDTTTSMKLVKGR